MNEIDDSNLAQCCNCGFVDYWDEIPKGRCPWSEDYLTECPECGEVDNMADYTVERAARIDAKKVSQALDRELMHMALDVMEAAIKAGDWEVDGACDPDWVLNALRARLAQPEREWQGLTDEEREEATGWSVEHIEAKLKQKNA